MKHLPAFLSELHNIQASFSSPSSHAVGSTVVAFLYLLNITYSAMWILPFPLCTPVMQKAGKGILIGTHFWNGCSPVLESSAIWVSPSLPLSLPASGRWTTSTVSARIWRQMKCALTGEPPWSYISLQLAICFYLFMCHGVSQMTHPWRIHPFSTNLTG